MSKLDDEIVTFLEKPKAKRLRKAHSSRWSDWEVWYRPAWAVGRNFLLYMVTSTRQNAGAIRDKLQKQGFLVELREKR